MYKMQIIDDEPYIHELIQLILEDSGLDLSIVDNSTNAAEGIKQFIECRPDIVITDICMPGMDGIDLIREMKKIANYDVKFILLSGYGEFSYAKQAIQLQVTNYLLKPIFSEELVEVLQKSLIEMKESSDQYEDRDTYKLVDGGSIIDCILLLSKNETKLAIDTFCTNCRIEKIAPKMALASSIHILCEAGEDKELSNIFSLKEWICNIEKCETLFQIQEQLETWGILCCESLLSCRIQKSNNIVGKLKSYVDEHYKESITLTELAERFYANPVYLGQAFYKTYDEHFHMYITGKRIGEAKRLLCEGKLKITEIAEAIGYSNYAVMKKNFVAVVGMTPSEYRKQEKGSDKEEEDGTDNFS